MNERLICFVFFGQNLFYSIVLRIGAERLGFIRYLYPFLFLLKKKKFHANSKLDIEIANGLVMNEAKKWKYKYFAIQFPRARERIRKFKDHKIVRREWEQLITLSKKLLQMQLNNKTHKETKKHKTLKRFFRELFEK